MFEQPEETKTIQLCRQVEEAVFFALACSKNPRLRDLVVVGVEPARGASRLRVKVTLEGGEDDLETDPETILVALRRAEGYLRGAVAGAIHRKRAPTLEFSLLPAPVWAEQEVDDG